MTKLNATFITMFQEPLKSYLGSSIIDRAIKNGILSAQVASILEHMGGFHHKIDDTPCGGGPGELMKVSTIEPLISESLLKNPHIERKNKRVILLDPAGVVFHQDHARRLAGFSELIFVCGRYEGIDARIHHFCDEAISLGDFVLSNGDLAAAAIFDATVRMIDGVLGNHESIQTESHFSGLLEASQYTRPTVYEDQAVPAVLTSGDHKKINAARLKESLIKTASLRPDLMQKYQLSGEEEKLLKEPRPERYPWQKYHE